MFQLAYNPTDGPVLIDAAGRSLGGGEFGAVDSAEPAARSAVDAGRLVIGLAKPGPGASDEARDAARRADTLASRAKAFAALDKPVLIDLATGLAVPTPLDADVPHKADLVSTLAHSDVDVPSGKPAVTTEPPKED